MAFKYFYPNDAWRAQIFFPRRPSEKAGLYEECEVVARLQDQQQYIQDLRSMLEYQVSVQVMIIEK